MASTILAQRLQDIEDAISTLNDNLTNLNVDLLRVVTELPTTTEAEENVIYFVPSAESGESNTYIEYALINGAFEKLGELSTGNVDLSAYATTEYVDQTIANAITTTLNTEV